MIDMSQYSDLTVRSGFSRYGAISFFTQSQSPCGIYSCASQQLVTSNDQHYQHVAAVFRSSMIVHITLRCHLFYLHYLTSNVISTASELTLSSAHPLKHFLHPHHFGTVAVNHASLIGLVPYGSIISRVFGFDEAAWSVVLQRTRQAATYEPFPLHFQSNGFVSDEHKEILQTLPLYQDGMDYWRVCEKYITGYLEVIYPNDHSLTEDQELNDFWNEIMTQFKRSETNQSENILSRSHLIEYLTCFLFGVTGFHEFFGNLAEYSGYNFPGKIRTNQYKADIQTFLLDTSLKSLTSGKMPYLINDWWGGGIFKGMRKNGANEPVNDSQLQLLRKNHDEWQENLRTLSHEIDRRNDTRLQPFNAMNPKNMECSVSV